MITAKCDKCGKDLKNYSDAMENKVRGLDLCTKCKKEWDTINQNLERQIFDAWFNGNISVLKNITPGKMKPEGYSNHDGSYYSCPFCGELYSDYTWPVGKTFECKGCGRLIIGY